MVVETLPNHLQISHTSYLYVAYRHFHKTRFTGANQSETVSYRRGWSRSLISSFITSLWPLFIPSHKKQAQSSHPSRSSQVTLMSEVFQALYQQNQVLVRDTLAWTSIGLMGNVLVRRSGNSLLHDRNFFNLEWTEIDDTLSRIDLCYRICKIENMFLFRPYRFSQQ